MRSSSSITPVRENAANSSGTRVPSIGGVKMQQTPEMQLNISLQSATKYRSWAMIACRRHRKKLCPHPFVLDSILDWNAYAPKVLPVNMHVYRLTAILAYYRYTALLTAILIYYRCTAILTDIRHWVKTVVWRYSLSPRSPFYKP